MVSVDPEILTAGRGAERQLWGMLMTSASMKRDICASRNLLILTISSELLEMTSGVGKQRIVLLGCNIRVISLRLAQARSAWSTPHNASRFYNYPLPPPGIVHGSLHF